MSELIELTGSELDAVGGGLFLDSLQNVIQNNGSQVGAQIQQQFNLVSFNGINFNF